MTGRFNNSVALILPLLLLVLVSCGKPPATPGVPVDSEKPVIIISHPTPGAVLDVDEEVVFEGKVTDNEGVATSFASLDGAEPLPVDLEEDGSFSHNFGALPFGPHTLAITASDAAGNTSSQQVQFTSSVTPLAACTDGTATIDVPDSGLAAALRSEFGLAPAADITCDLMQTLTNLGAYGKGIRNLEGLQHAVELDSLYLVDNEIQDLRPLAGLLKLTILNLSHNEVADVAPLANLGALASLSLWANNITDLMPLANLSNLEALYLSNNGITDVTPLVNLPALAVLDLWDNEVADASPLYGLLTLRNLYLSNNPLSSLAGINALQNLELLWLADLNLGDTDLQALEGLTKLQSLMLDRNDLTNLDNLPELPALNELRAASNRISSLQPLVENSGLGSGDWLDMGENCLDFSNPGTTNYAERFQLEGRGVSVKSDNQKSCA